MALNTELWLPIIANNLFPNNGHQTRSVDDSAYVNYKTVHVPQAGSVPTVYVGTPSLPMAIAQRTDDEVTYDLTPFRTQPIVLEQGVETVEISYDKRSSVLNEHVLRLQQMIGSYLLNTWGSTVAGSKISTTGTARGAGFSDAPGASSTNPKAITEADILKAKKIMDKAEVPMENRFLLLGPEAYTDLAGITRFTEADKLGGVSVIPSGVLGMLHGFNIMMRTRALVYANGGTSPKPITAASATNDLGAALAWHPSFVRRAVGNVQIFDNTGDAAYQGDVFSALVRVGGAKTYKNELGIVSIIEG